MECGGACDISGGSEKAWERGLERNQQELCAHQDANSGGESCPKILSATGHQRQEEAPDEHV